MSMQTPPPPPVPVAASADDAASMSTAETLSNIFFEPGRTFESLRRRPRFLVAALIMIALATAFTILLFQKMDFERFMREQIEKSPRAEQMTPEQKDAAVKFQTGTFGKALVYVTPVIASLVIFAAGAGIYLLGSMLMGGTMNYWQSLSVWVYSSLPPAVLLTVANFVLLLVKSRDDIDIGQSSTGLVRANLGVFLPSGSSPVLAAVLNSFDIFTFYGLFLAAVGLRKVARMSSGSAWAVVLGLWIISIIVKVAWAAAFGSVT